MGATEETRQILAAKFQAIFPHLDERQRRLLMGAEARSLGHGGIRLVARAAGVREATVSLGAAELDSGAEPLGRVRRPGGGRKRAADLDPRLLPALLALVEPDERGDPMSPLRWTTKSTRNLADELTRQGHRVGADTVGDLLRGEGFSLQGNAKTLEGQRHPDRDAQFRYISEQVKAHQETADPVISVDTKKKELVGQFANAGREWRPAGRPVLVNSHDFPQDSAGRAVPYGVYDVTGDTGWVSVGTDHDTAAFAVESVRRWWKAAGRDEYPAARRLLVTATRRLQRLPHPGLEGRARRPGRRDRAGDHRLPLPARDVEVEQGRAPALLPHHDELAGTAADQPRGHRPDHRRDHHPHRAAGPRRAGRQHLRHWRQDQRPANGRPAPDPPRLARRLELHPPPRGIRPGRRHPRAIRPAQPRPGLALPPALTGLPAAEWDALTAALMTLHDQQREASLDKRRGHRPRLTAPGTGRRPALTLADRLLAAILHYRLALPQVAIAALFGVRPETVNKRIRDIRQLLDQAGHTIQPSPHRLASLDDLYKLARSTDIAIQPEIKTAC